MLHMASFLLYNTATVDFNTSLYPEQSPDFTLQPASLFSTPPSQIFTSLLLDCSHPVSVDLKTAVNHMGSQSATPCDEDLIKTLDTEALLVPLVGKAVHILFLMDAGNQCPLTHGEKTTEALHLVLFPDSALYAAFSLG